MSFRDTTTLPQLIKCHRGMTTGVIPLETSQKTGVCLFWLKKRMPRQFACRFSRIWMPDKHSLGEIQKRFLLLSLNEGNPCRVVSGRGSGLRKD